LACLRRGGSRKLSALSKRRYFDSDRFTDRRLRADLRSQGARAGAGLDHSFCGVLRRDLLLFSILRRDDHLSWNVSPHCRLLPDLLDPPSLQGFTGGRGQQAFTQTKDLCGGHHHLYNGSFLFRSESTWKRKAFGQHLFGYHQLFCILPHLLPKPLLRPCLRGKRRGSDRALGTGGNDRSRLDPHGCLLFHVFGQRYSRLYLLEEKIYPPKSSIKSCENSFSTCITPLGIKRREDTKKHCACGTCRRAGAPKALY